MSERQRRIEHLREVLAKPEPEPCPEPAPCPECPERSLFSDFMIYLGLTLLAVLVGLCGVFVFKFSDTSPKQFRACWVSPGPPIAGHCWPWESKGKAIARCRHENEANSNLYTFLECNDDDPEDDDTWTVWDQSGHKKLIEVKIP